MRRFEDNAINPGLSMLYYGMPGTGKTELVKQIAKLNNRILLLVDVASIKSKWVGESEKNIKRVFNEYRQAMKFYDETPILFFNECDALISKRNDVQSSVDQMNNTMQNILLQELEDFKGIFIATTNLIHNIDKAFDRRILYKLYLDEPENETRFKILKSHFPHYSDTLLLEISTKNNLTGGQIQNLKRKFLVEQILFKNVESTEENFRNYVDNELNFRKNKKRSIGFS
jgi:SpoVK/Ycf46/Vps4 family AAA+-type ATPase